MRSTTLALVASLLLGGAPIMGGCAASHSSVRSDAKERALLGAVLQTYWHGVRWNDPIESAAFIEDPNRRGDFQTWLGDSWEDVRFVDVTVLEIDVSEEQPASDKGWTRTANVRVRTEGYQLPAQILEKTDHQQTWYRTSQGWWLDWSPQE